MPISHCSDFNGKASAAAGGVARTSYVPPHLRNRPPSAEAALAPISHSGGHLGHSVASAGGFTSAGRNGGGSSRVAVGGGACNNRGNGWDRGRERELILLKMT